MLWAKDKNDVLEIDIIFGPTKTCFFKYFFKFIYKGKKLALFFSNIFYGTIKSVEFLRNVFFRTHKKSRFCKNIS